MKLVNKLTVVIFRKLLVKKKKNELPFLLIQIYKNDKKFAVHNRPLYSDVKNLYSI